MKTMEFQVYESEANGSGKTHRVYFGDAPKFISESVNWKLVYSELKEVAYSPKEVGNFFVKRPGLKPNYIDQNSGSSRFGIGFSDLEKLTILNHLKEFLKALDFQI